LRILQLLRRNGFASTILFIGCPAREKAKTALDLVITGTDSRVRRRNALFGLVVRKERWGLSWRGWLIAAAGAMLVNGVVLTNIYPFLALTDRVDARVLVVEGWVREYAFQASVRELETGRYEQVFTTGGPVIGAGGYSSDYNTAASVGAERLKAAGAPDELIQMAPSRVADRDRTFGSAVALCNWLRQHDRKVQAINVITEDTHARRTRLLFEKAFHGGTMVGVVSVPSPDYDAKHWWRYSQGIEDVVGQGSAYLYARLFFNPSPPDQRTRSSVEKQDPPPRLIE